MICPLDDNVEVLLKFADMLLARYELKYSIIVCEKPDDD